MRRALRQGGKASRHRFGCRAADSLARRRRTTSAQTLIEMDITLRRTMANSDIANCDGSPHAYDRRFPVEPRSNTTPTMTTRCPDVTLVALLGRMLL
jgi:hypothetical protein